MPLHLHIFEERYRLMIQHVLKTNHTIGVSLIKSGEEALGPLPEPHQTGCTARIMQVEPLEDGHFNLTVIGDERFHIIRMGVGQPYLTAFAESTPLKSHHTMEVVRGAHGLRDRLVKYLSLLVSHVGKEGEDETNIQIDFNLAEIQLPEDPMLLIYLSAALLQLPPAEKQPLLEADTAGVLLEKVQRMYRRELAVLPPLLQISPDEARGLAEVN